MLSFMVAATLRTATYASAPAHARYIAATNPHVPQLPRNTQPARRGEHRVWMSCCTASGTDHFEIGEVGGSDDLMTKILADSIQKTTLRTIQN